MSLVDLSREILPAIEVELKKSVAHPLITDYSLYEMLTYHMGWTGEGEGLQTTGKRIRPLLTILSTQAAGGEWKNALPAAAGVELIHNFSLIHDDIQDCSHTRRGRKTVWVKWGEAHAINAGDLMFTLGFACLNRLREASSADIVIQAQSILQETCVSLTKGQYLDMSFERAKESTLEDYWAMIGGKTGALLAASTQLGALCAGSDLGTQQIFKTYGLNLGLAFQIWDDWLGIWGDEVKTGKSTSSDLVSGKKTYPVIYGLCQKGKFAARWRKGPIPLEEVEQIEKYLQEDGTKEATLKKAQELTLEAISTLNLVSSDLPAYQALVELTNSLLQRQR
jgi:geranylgeranyl diphosphate synthase type I